MQFWHLKRAMSRKIYATDIENGEKLRNNIAQGYNFKRFQGMFTFIRRKQTGDHGRRQRIVGSGRGQAQRCPRLQSIRMKGTER